MTKQIEPDMSASDRPVLEIDLQEGAKSFKGFKGCIPERNYSGKHPFSFEGLSFAEGYIEGRIEAIFYYRHMASADRDISASIPPCGKTLHVRHQSAMLIKDFHACGMKIGRGWQNALMLIGDVEPVQIEEAMLPSRVGLDVVANKIDDRLGGTVSSFYMSLDGTLNRGPILGEGEATKLGRGLPIGFNENTVGVIKGSTEIMEGIAKNGWRMFGGIDSLHRPSGFQRALLILERESFYVIRDVVSEKSFELVDVLIGPFYFQEWAREIEGNGHV